MTYFTVVSQVNIAMIAFDRELFNRALTGSAFFADPEQNLVYAHMAKPCYLVETMVVIQMRTTTD